MARKKRVYGEADKERIKRWRKQNKEKYQGQWLRSNIKKLGVDITESEYYEMVDDQNGVCLICHKPDPKGRLCIDHDHDTMKVRGLLCRSCNLALGNFKDDPLLLERAALYLQRRLLLNE